MLTKWDLMDMLKYAARQQENINLADIDPATGELKHKALLDQVPDAVTLDKLLFNELLSMVTGESAKALYVTSNINESGVEMWRRMHKNNDPKINIT